MIVALEGIDGSGKTELADLLSTALRARAISTDVFRFSKNEPSLAHCAQNIIQTGPEGKYYALHSIFAAARLAHLSYFWRHEHDIVLVDRYKYSTQVYGVCQGLTEAWCISLEAPLPEAKLVLLLDLPTEVAMLRKRNPDALDLDVELQKSVRNRYLDCARAAGWHILDARAPREQVLTLALNTILTVLGAPVEN